MKREGSIWGVTRSVVERRSKAEREERERAWSSGCDRVVESKRARDSKFGTCAGGGCGGGLVANVVVMV